MDAIHGVTLEEMATQMSKWSELKTKFGEKKGDLEFASYLASKGFGT